MNTRWPFIGLFTLLLFALAAGWLGRRGAFQAGFDGNPDEAAHVITGTMIRDYLVSGAPDSPMAYAERYYAAYPKVAFGVWPPLFHLLEGFWFLLWEPSRQSVVWLMAGLLALAGVIQYRALQPEMGRRAAAVLAVLLVSLPQVVGTYSVVIVDGLLLPLTLTAGWFFARYLTSLHWRDSFLFGLFSGLAFLTKYNAFLLVFVPFVAIALTRRWSVWRQPSLWIAPATVLALAGPWYLAHSSLVVYAADMGATAFPTLLAASAGNLQVLGGVLGIAVLLSGAGFLACLAKGAFSPTAGVMAGLLAGTWLMHSLLYPAVELRYLLPGVPALLYFLHAGALALDRFTRSLFTQRLSSRYALLACGVLVACARTHVPAPAPVPAWLTFGHQVQSLASTNTVLVGGDGMEEGAVVAEMALRDPHRHHQPSWLVLRASKMLARTSWMGAHYRLVHDSPGEVLEALNHWHVSVVALSRRDAQPHSVLLRSALANGHPQWREQPSPVAGMRLFARTSPPEGPRQPMEVDLTYTIGRKVSFPR